METQTKKSVFITLTAPTCAGKSYLLSYIRDVAKLPCFVSTTTRPPRAGEVEGQDYYFISQEESELIEKANGFAELAIFRGYRYGVTKQEFRKKLASGAAFLIVEPTGIDHYAKPALEEGATWLKYYVDVPTEIRVERFKKRFFSDVEKAVESAVFSSVNPDNEHVKKIVLGTIRNYTDRLIHMLGPELKWKEMVTWDGILQGDVAPEVNLSKILNDVSNLNK